MMGFSHKEWWKFGMMPLFTATAMPTHVLLLQQRQGTSYLFPHSRIDYDEFPCDGANAGHP